MTEPVTTAFTASAIAQLAFQEFIKSASGEVAKKFTGSAIAKMDELRKLLWDQLRGKHALSEDALQQAESGDEKAIEMVGKLLDVEMFDPIFAEQLRLIVQMIEAGKQVDNNPMEQHIIGTHARGWQIQANGGTNNIGEFHQYGVDCKPNLK
jgi:hypothetical protein